MDNKTPPVLKAWNRIFDLLKCIHDNPYNRLGFEEAVLKLYQSEYSKSVFRGMAIPTLRNLGFILGYNDVIRISANGNLVYLAHSCNREEGLRALRAILMEFDESIGVVSFLKDKSAYPIELLIGKKVDDIVIDDPRTRNKPQSQKRAAKERLQDWIRFLGFSGILNSDGKNVLLDKDIVFKTKNDLDTNRPKKREIFKTYLIPTYRQIVISQKGVSTVKIEELRTSMATVLFKQENEIVTEDQFDRLFSEFPKTTDKYIISLGRSMGADEKLFYFQGKYYQTLFIRFL